MMSVAAHIAEEMELSEELRVKELLCTMEPKASPGLRLKVVRVMRKVGKAMYFICSFHNANVREIVKD